MGYPLDLPELHSLKLEIGNKCSASGALELSKGQRVNIYTDSKNAYLTLHGHATIWKERQFKTTTGEPIKHFREIERLLTAIYCPKEVAVMHCKGTAGMGVK